MQNHANKRFKNTHANVMAAIAIGAMLIFSVTGIKAFADNIQDDIQVSPPERTITIPGINDDGTLKDASTIVKYWIDANSAGGASFQGCDASDGSSVTVRLIVPSGAVRVSPESLTFSQCGDESTNTKSATYTSNTPGDYFITVSATDTAGRYNPGEATFLLHVRPPLPPSDETDPTISITSPDDGATLTSDSVKVSGTASDSGSGLAKVEVQVDGGSYSAATGTDSWSFDVTNLSEGSHTITAKATDKAGRTATDSVEVTYAVPDETNPAISITSPSDGATLTSDIVTVEGTASDSGSGLEKVEVQVNGGSYNTATGTSTWSSSVTLTEGPNTITAKATDRAGNTATDSVDVTYTPPDTTPPTLKVPTTPVIAEATGPNGAEVSYAELVTATDDRDPSPTITCTPASGSTFALGTTEVTCDATDAAGNNAEPAKFSVTVQDTTAPKLTVPSSNPTAEATGSNGATVTYTATATDAVDTDPTVTCTPASGSTFALGTTEVTCDATDAAGNNAEPAKFSVTVQDTTAPKLTVPADMSIKATGVDGATVTYTATATDAVDTDPTVTCTPASGSTVPVGTTTVSCTATDDSGNTSPAATFKVSVTLTMVGFYQPVDMGSTLNTVKGGSTVPFKFEIFAGSTELTSTTFNGNPIGSFSAKKVACPGGAAEDQIEQVVTATGGTVLRYDSTSGQFVYNWQTPKTPVGACYDTTFTVTADGSTLTAHFKTK